MGPTEDAKDAEDAAAADARQQFCSRTPLDPDDKGLKHTVISL